MKKLIMAMVLITTLLFTASSFAGGAIVHHVVLLSVKDDVSPEQVDQMITVAKALLSQIPGVLEVSAGKKAREDRPVHVKDYDVGLYIKWESLEAGEVYGPHILHQSFIKLYKPILSGLKVIDFYGN